MVVFFTRFIAVVLTMITIAQSAPLGTDRNIIESCQNILSQHFYTGEKDGKFNFIQSFQNLTKKGIQEYYSEKEEEESYKATERLTSLQLNQKYFESILNTNGIRNVNCKNKQLWCQTEAEDLYGELPSFATKDHKGIIIKSAQQLSKVCDYYIMKISSGFTLNVPDVDTIMKILYEDASEDMMNYVNIMGKESRNHGLELINYHTFFLNKFAKPFYDCYVTLLMNNIKNLSGPYMSVPEFCSRQGIQIIKDFKGLGSAPFSSNRAMCWN